MSDVEEFFVYVILIIFIISFLPNSLLPSTKREKEEQERQKRYKRTEEREKEARLKAELETEESKKLNQERLKKEDAELEKNLGIKLGDRDIFLHDVIANPIQETNKDKSRLRRNKDD
tara:strand:+ start:253 stop:606 length:354 start_codon:yes stop_codon:yes gene_type:complete